MNIYIKSFLLFYNPVSVLTGDIIEYSEQAFDYVYNAIYKRKYFKALKK